MLRKLTLYMGEIVILFYDILTVSNVESPSVYTQVEFRGVLSL